MIAVKILGAGCANCKKLEAEARAALDEAGIPYELDKVTDYAEIATYRVLYTPGLVIDEKVVSSGKIPKRDEIVAWAREAETRVL